MSSPVVPLPGYRLRRVAPVAPVVPVLDAGQQAVVDHDTGRLLVLAGPGTGKTTTLVEAAVARVRRGVPVDDLLLLTFGRRAAAELRDRITARLDQTVREPLARTVHSYAFGVLRLAASLRGDPAPRLLAAAEQDVIVRELIEGHLERGRTPWPEALRPALRTRGFAAEVRDLMLRAVERGLDGPALSAVGAARGRPDWVAAGTFLAEYQDVTALARPGSYDPAELVRSAVRLLQDTPDLLAAERNRRRRIFVDEYQDTDAGQAELIALLADAADELVVVGDPDQSIYAFRGADPHAFDTVLADAPQVALTGSRRSGRTLLDASRRVAARLPGPAAHRRLSAPADGGELTVRSFRSPGEEVAAVAAQLRRAHLDGLPWDRMAVLLRSTTGRLGQLRRAFAVAGIPVAVRSEDLPLAEQPAAGALLDLLEVVLQPGTLDEAGAEALLTGPVGRADALLLRRLRRVLADLCRAAGRPEPAPLAELLLDPASAGALPGPVAAPARRVARVLAAGRAAVAAGGSVEDVLWAIWDATGLAGRWEGQSRGASSAAAVAGRNLDAAVALFDAAARFTDRLPGASAAEFLDQIRAQQLPGDPDGVRPGPGQAVAVLTAHAAKGLEWDLVCVVGVQEGVWPDLRPRGSLLGTELLVDVLAGQDAPGISAGAARLAEERRLFYVAVTRARHRLMVTAVDGEDEQPSRFLDEVLPGWADLPRPSRQGATHLADLVADLRSVVTDPAADPDLRDAAAGNLARLADSGVPGAAPESWWGLAELSSADPVVDPAATVSISPSRVESYLKCELRALLEQAGARDDDGAAATLGTLVHQVAAQLPDGDAEALDRLLGEQWHTLDFGARWLADNKRVEARDMVLKLARWVSETRARLALVDVERDFEVAVPVSAAPVVLRGSVDRLERDADGRLVVVDLKTTTSTPTKAQVARHPQLGAYQAAIEAGAFPGDGDRSGGARLVNLKAGQSSAKDQPQSPLADDDEPGWALEQVDQVARLMRGSTFRAIRNPDCPRCALRSCCPLSDEGRQVTG